MDVKIGKISFNLESPDLANKDAFKKAFKKHLDVDAYWKLISAAKSKSKRAK